MKLIGQLLVINMKMRALWMVIIHQNPFAADTVHANQAPLKPILVMSGFGNLMNGDLNNVPSPHDELFVPDQRRPHMGIIYLY